MVIGTEYLGLGSRFGIFPSNDISFSAWQRIKTSHFNVPPIAT